MTGAGACGGMRHALGVYVLGAIGPADRGAVDSHLACCGHCREELAGLAGLPALLGRVPASEAAGLLAGAEESASREEHLAGPGLRSLLGRAAGRRPRLRPRLATAAAAGLIAGAGAVAVVQALQPPAPRLAAPALPWAAAVGRTSPQTHASVTIRYASEPWGMEVAVQVSGIPAGTRCELQITSSRGQEVTAGGWTIARGHQNAWYPASSPVSLSGIRSFVVTAGTRVLVTVPVRQAQAAR